MESLKKAIELAERKGYKLEPSYVDFVTERMTLHSGDVLLDPLFWEALFPIVGKSNSITSSGGKVDSVSAEVYNGYLMPVWLARAHRFFDLQLTGKNTESFWEEIINSNES